MDPEQGENETKDPEKISHRPLWIFQRTPLERTLLTLLLVITGLCGVLVVLLAQQRFPLPVFRAELSKDKCLENNTNCARICVTETCVKAAADLLRNMDLQADPCEDFFQFACGHWDKHHSLPPDRPHYDTFAQMKDELKSMVRDLLTEEINEEDSNATRNAKNLYISCMNESTIETRGEQPLLDLLETLGGWPVIIGSNWTEENFDWVLLMAKLRQYHNDILVGQWVGPDGKNSSLHIIQLDQADLGLPAKDYYIRGSQQMEAYFKFMVDITVLLGTPMDRAMKEMEEVLEFEVQLSNITIPSEERRNYTAIYNKMTLADLNERVNKVNWTLYFKTLMPLNISDKEEIVVYSVEYMRNMANLVEATPKRTVANYLMWRFAYNRVSNLDKRFLDKQQEFFKALIGTQTTPARWKTCTTYVNKIMGMAVGALFVKKHFNEKSKETAEAMISDIKTAFLDLLAEVDWMDDETRDVAREKAETMSQKIGFPGYILRPTDLDKDYNGVQYLPDKYFENVLVSLKHIARKELLKLRKLVDKHQWVTSPAVVNAFYTRSKNFISFPAGILQPPLYHQGYPKSLNYGGIGVVIGHEITHGFDDKGRQFDEHGNLKQWWKPEALKKFQMKAACMVNQYSSYIMPGVGLRLNGINTQGENIADNGGVKQAFRAYRNWVIKHGAEELLPGIGLSHHQLFFLNYAQIWCGVMRPEAAINNIKTGAHSPGRFRVIGALSNSKDFAEAYQCKLGSPMNPVHKCEVW